MVFGNCWQETYFIGDPSTIRTVFYSSMANTLVMDSSVILRLASKAMVFSALELTGSSRIFTSSFFNQLISVAAITESGHGESYDAYLVETTACGDLLTEFLVNSDVYLSNLSIRRLNFLSNYVSSFCFVSFSDKSPLLRFLSLWIFYA